MSLCVCRVKNIIVLWTWSLLCSMRKPGPQKGMHFTSHFVYLGLTTKVNRFILPSIAIEWKDAGQIKHGQSGRPFSISSWYQGNQTKQCVRCLKDEESPTVKCATCFIQEDGLYYYRPKERDNSLWYTDVIYFDFLFLQDISVGRNTWKKWVQSLHHLLASDR